MTNQNPNNWTTEGRAAANLADPKYKYPNELAELIANVDDPYYTTHADKEIDNYETIINEHSWMHTVVGTLIHADNDWNDQDFEDTMRGYHSRYDD